jgi:hypothetical protein
MVKHSIIGDQTENSKTGFLHFLVRNPDFRVSKSFDRNISVSVVRYRIDLCKPYKLVEDILSDVKLIPLDTKVYSVNQLSRFIMEDALVPPAAEYEEHGIVAYSGTNSFDKPIAMVINDGKETYYAHPEISRLVRRINVQAVEKDVSPSDIQ